MWMADYRISAAVHNHNSYHTCTPHVGGEGQA